MNQERARAVASVMTGLVRYVIAITAACIVTILIVQDVIVARERKGCERRQQIFRAIERGFSEAARGLPEGQPLKSTLEGSSDEINAKIIKDCNEFYPKIIDWVK